MPQSVGTSQSRLSHLGQRKPCERSLPWQEQSEGAGEASSVGKPISIRSAVLVVWEAGVAPVVRVWTVAGGGTASKNKSLKWFSLMATLQLPVDPT